MNFKLGWNKIIISLLFGFFVSYLFSGWQVFGGGFNFSGLLEFFKYFRYGVIEIMILVVSVILYVLISLIEKKA
jgi:hypothetical protein